METMVVDHAGAQKPPLDESLTARRSAGMDIAIDALIVVALQDELDAVLAEGGGASAWREIRDRDGLPTS